VPATAAAARPPGARTSREEPRVSQDEPTAGPVPAATEPVPAIPAVDERFDADGRPLDPRAIARASLAADRNWSLWVVAGATLFCVALALAAGTPVGALAFAAFLACCAAVRAVVRRAPSALVVRSRPVDVLALAGLALTIGVLSQVVPTPLP
jgi:hypothetical protein